MHLLPCSGRGPGGLRVAGAEAIEGGATPDTCFSAVVEGLWGLRVAGTEASEGGATPDTCFSAVVEGLGA